MQEIIDHLRKECREFLEQRKLSMCAIECHDDDSAYVFATIDELDEHIDDSVFILFHHPCFDLNAYVDGVVAQIKAERAISYLAALEEKESAEEIQTLEQFEDIQILSESEEEPIYDEGLIDDEIPPLPESLFDHTLDPLERFKDAIRYLKEVVADTGFLLVLGFIPTEISNAKAWIDIINLIIPIPENRATIAGIRTFIRKPADRLDIPDKYTNLPLIKRVFFDCGPQAITDSFVQTIKDESQPVPKRMEAMLHLAILDYAHKRYDAAIEKYDHLLGYYQEQDDKTMQAIVLNGRGDIEHREGQYDKAEDWYERASLPAAESGSPIALYMITKNLGDVSFAKANYPKAEAYYEQGAILAEHQVDPQSRAIMLKHQGEAQRKQDKDLDTITTWEKEAKLCRNFNMKAELRDCLTRLEKHYRDLGQSDKALHIQIEREKMSSTSQNEVGVS